MSVSAPTPMRRGPACQTIAHLLVLRVGALDLEQDIVVDQVLQPMQLGIDVVDDGVLLARLEVRIASDDGPHDGVDVRLDTADAVGGGDVGDDRVVLLANGQRLNEQCQVDTAHEWPTWLATACSDISGSM